MSFSFDFIDEICVDLANRLIEECSSDINKVEFIQEIDGNFLTSIYKSITGYTIPDLVSCNDKVLENEHNIQSVIDTLSLDVLKKPLSHINGEHIAAGNTRQLYSLLSLLKKLSKVFNLSKPVIPQESKDIPNGITIPMEQKASRKPVSKLPTFKSTSQVAAVHETSIAKDDDKTDKIVKMKYASKQKRNSHSSPYPTRKSRSKGNGITFVKKDGIHTQEKNVGALSRHDIATNSAMTANPLKNKDFFKKNSLNQGENIESKAVRLADAESKRKLNAIENLYKSNLQENYAVLKNENKYYNLRATQMKKVYLQSLQKTPSKKSHLKPCNKSFLLPYNLRKSTSYCIRKNGHLKQRSLFSSSKATTTKHAHPDLLQEIFQEFPGVKLNSSTMNRLTSKYHHHVYSMHEKLKQCLLKKPKSLKQIEREDAAARLSILTKLTQKDIKEREHLKFVQENKILANSIKFIFRDEKMKSAKVKAYYKEFQEMQKKMHKQSVSDQMILEKAFLHAMDTQKSQIEELCRQVKEADQLDMEQHSKYLVALENLYHNQLSMLSETFTVENKLCRQGIKAQKEAKNTLERESQKLLKNEIEANQKMAIEMTHDTHFIELDGERFVRKIRRM